MNDVYAAMPSSPCGPVSQLPTASRPTPAAAEYQEDYNDDEQCVGVHDDLSIQGGHSMKKGGTLKGPACKLGISEGQRQSVVRAT